MVGAVTLTFCSIQKIFSKKICVKLGISNLTQSPGIGQNLYRDISDIWIFGQSFINESCHNSRACNDIKVKIGPVIKLDKKNRATLK